MRRRRCLQGGTQRPLFIYFYLNFFSYLAYGLVQHASFPTLPNLTEPLMLNTANLRCNSQFNQNVLKSRWVTCQTDQLIVNRVDFDIPVRCEQDLKGGGTVVSHCFTPRQVTKCSLTVNVTQDPNVLKCHIQPEYCRGQTTLTGWRKSEGSSHVIPSKDLLVVTKKSSKIECLGEIQTSDNLVFFIESGSSAFTFIQSR